MDQSFPSNDPSLSNLPPNQNFQQGINSENKHRKSNFIKKFFYIIFGLIGLLLCCFILLLTIVFNSEPTSGLIFEAKKKNLVSHAEVNELFINYREHKGQKRIDFVNDLIGKEVHWVGIVKTIEDNKLELVFGGKVSNIVNLSNPNLIDLNPNDMIEFIAIIDEFNHFLGQYTIKLINPSVISVIRPNYDPLIEPTLFYDISSPIFKKSSNTSQPTIKIVTPILFTPTETFESFFTPSPINSITTTFTSTLPTPSQTYTVSVTTSVTSSNTPTRSPSPTLSRTPSPTPTHTPSRTPTKTPSRTLQYTSTTTPLVVVPSLLGKSVTAVESIIGKTILITPNDDYDDSTAGGEYRDYYIGNYLVFISYDKYGISRIFTVLEGLEAENYSLNDWKILLPKFGIFTDSEPDLKAQTLYSWNNQNGLYIGIASFSSKGYPVWTVKIAQKGYE